MLPLRSTTLRQRSSIASRIITTRSAVARCSSSAGRMSATTNQTTGSSSTQKETSFTTALKNNASWAQKICSSKPDFFRTSATGQTPSILWLGCADSRIPESTILDLEPGNVFVHRNIANILTDNDLSSLSVIEYAVRYLGVSHAVVCGHTGCGGVNAALGNAPLGVIDPWIQPLRRLRLKHAAELEKIESFDEKMVRLAELNVLKSMETLKGNATVIEAVKTRGLTVHGVIYDLASGRLREVEDPESEQDAKERLKCFDTCSA